MTSPRVAVIGTGIAGLTAAVDLARQGCEVLMFERAATPGGKLREVHIDGIGMDAGPSVFTLRRVFDELFDDAGDAFDARVSLIRAGVLARHSWDSHESLDLFADVARSTAAIGEFAGLAEARSFSRLAAQAQRVYATLDGTFMRAARPSPWRLMRRVGFGGLRDLWNIRPFTTLWQAMEGYFRDPRLRQLFGRYATYCGSSPFQSPATLMLIAHVEQAGVWYVDGGMQRLVDEVVALALRLGARLRCRAEVRAIVLARGRVAAVELEGGERVEVDAVVCNADNNALASGLFGPGAARSIRATPAARRSLSAITWNLHARTEGFALAHHTVFFGDDYGDEFEAIFERGQVPACPTIYVCAQDRHDDAGPAGHGAERLFILVNAPPTGDVHEFDAAEIESCGMRMFGRLAALGLRVERRPAHELVTTPGDFHRLFPATGGALYGPASHGWRASFTRPGARSGIPGLYLAGGSTHPGPGVPMAATSGRLAASSLMTDCVSTSRFRSTATSGGTSTH